MAFHRTLDLYKDLILLRLADGPKTQAELDVPKYACEALKREGLIYSKSRCVRTTTGRIAVLYWYPAGYEEPALRDCATMTFDGLAQHNARLPHSR